MPTGIDWLGWIVTGFGIAVLGLVGKVMMDLVLMLFEVRRGQSRLSQNLWALFGFGIMLLCFAINGAAATWLVNGVAVLTSYLRD